MPGFEHKRKTDNFLPKLWVGVEYKRRPWVAMFWPDNKKISSKTTLPPAFGPKHQPAANFQDVAHLQTRSSSAVRRVYRHSPSICTSTGGGFVGWASPDSSIALPSAGCPIGFPARVSPPRRSHASGYHPINLQNIQTGYQCYRDMAGHQSKAVRLFCRLTEFRHS